MNKKELCALANTGKTNIGGVDVYVTIKPGPIDGSPWIEITACELSPLHQSLILGQKWCEFVTDEECAELPAALARYKAEAETFCEKAKRIVKCHTVGENAYQIDEVPDDVKEDWKAFPATLKRFTHETHKKLYIDSTKHYWYAPGIFTLELDGVRYVPHWSYYLDRAYYEETQTTEGDR